MRYSHFIHAIVSQIHAGQDFPDELSAKYSFSIYYFPVNEAPDLLITDPQSLVTIANRHQRLPALGHIPKSRVTIANRHPATANSDLKIGNKYFVL